MADGSLQAIPGAILRSAVSRFETNLVALGAAICLTDRPMSMHNQSLRRKAIQMLLLATVFWGMSFPTMKSVVMVQQQLLPNASTWPPLALGLKKLQAL